MEIKVAFFKGDGDWHNRTVRWWTKSPYSHAELILPDGKTWISISPFLTSKVAKRNKPTYDENKWDLIILEITEEQLNTIMEFYEQTEGCGYDWAGMLLSQFLPFSIKRKSCWYCSEWIAYALRIACVIDWKTIKIYDRCDLSPQVLYNIVTTSNQ